MSGAIERLTGRLGRSPSIAEIAEELKTTPEEVLEAMEVGLRLLDRVALHRARAATRSSTRSRRSAARTRSSSAPRTAPRSSPRSTACPTREREILRMRFEEGLPQTQIAQRVGLSQMHVSRLIRKSLSIMREELHAHAPRRCLSSVKGTFWCPATPAESAELAGILPRGGHACPPKKIWRELNGEAR